MDKRSSLTGLMLEQTAKRIRQYCQRMLSEYQTGITVDQWLVLHALSQADGQSQLELARKIQKDAPTLTRIIDLLVQKALLERKNDPADRRKALVFLTAAGRDKVAEAWPIILECRHQSFAALTDAEIDSLIIILGKILPQ